MSAEEADRLLTEADIPCTLIYTAAEIEAFILGVRDGDFDNLLG